MLSSSADDRVIAYYDFEESVPSGPNTYWLREKEGRVDLSATYRVHRR